MQIEGRKIGLSNLEKILWPQLGLTKADLLAYHHHMSPWTTKHWQGRPLTVTRFPHGVEQSFFYQKNVPKGAPQWVKTQLVQDTEYVLANDLSTVAWLVNLGSIEFHPALYQGARSDLPSYAVIDLDPAPPSGFKEAVKIAKRSRDLLSKLNLQGYPKLSGVSGIHIYIPLQPRYSFAVSAELVRLIGVELKQAYPGEVTLERLLKKRRGVYVDYLQNHPAKTIVGVYSPRPTATATVSAAVDWADLDVYLPQDFTIKTVPLWLDKRGDLFEAVREKPQSLEHLPGFFCGS